MSNTYIPEWHRLTGVKTMKISTDNPIDSKCEVCGRTAERNIFKGHNISLCDICFYKHKIIEVNRLNSEKEETINKIKNFKIE